VLVKYFVNTTKLCESDTISVWIDGGIGRTGKSVYSDELGTLAPAGWYKTIYSSTGYQWNGTAWTLLTYGC
jgi:hypothetical protein